MMRDNELLTPLVTDSLEGSKAVTRSALQRGVHQVRVYHRSVPLTAQQREGRGNQTGVERYSKLGDVTYFIHYKDIQGTIRGKYESSDKETHENRNMDIQGYMQKYK